MNPFIFIVINELQFSGQNNQKLSAKLAELVVTGFKLICVSPGIMTSKSERDDCLFLRLSTFDDLSRNSKTSYRRKRKVKLFYWIKTFTRKCIIFNRSSFDIFYYFANQWIGNCVIPIS